MDKIVLDLSEWIKSIIKDTVAELVAIYRRSDEYKETMDIGQTARFLGISKTTFNEQYRYLSGFPKELPAKRWSKRALIIWLENQI